MHVNDFKSNFEGFPEKHWSLYVPEQQVIQIIRDMLPETAEWRFVKMKIMQGEPDGDDFVRAIGKVRTFIHEFTSRQAKRAIHQTSVNMQKTHITGSPGIPQGKSTKTDAEKKAANDKACLDPEATCYGCGARGHKSNWWGCPQYEATQKKKKEDRKRKGGGRGRGRGRGKGSGRGGGKGGRNRREKKKKDDDSQDSSAEKERAPLAEPFSPRILRSAVPGACEESSPEPLLLSVW